MSKITFLIFRALLLLSAAQRIDGALPKRPELKRATTSRFSAFNVHTVEQFAPDGEEARLAFDALIAVQDAFYGALLEAYNNAMDPELIPDHYRISDKTVGKKFGGDVFAKKAEECVRNAGGVALDAVGDFAKFLEKKSRDYLNMSMGCAGKIFKRHEIAYKNSLEINVLVANLRMSAPPTPLTPPNVLFDASPFIGASNANTWTTTSSRASTPRSNPSPTNSYTASSAPSTPPARTPSSNSLADLIEKTTAQSTAPSTEQSTAPSAARRSSKRTASFASLASTSSATKVPSSTNTLRESETLTPSVTVTPRMIKNQRSSSQRTKSIRNRSSASTGSSPSNEKTAEEKKSKKKTEKEDSTRKNATVKRRKEEKEEKPETPKKSSSTKNKESVRSPHKSQRAKSTFGCKVI